MEAELSYRQEELRNDGPILPMLWRAVEQSADLVVITDAAGVIQYVNPAFERLTGYSRAEAIGRTPRILKSGGQSRDFYTELWQTIRSGHVFRGTLANRNKQGEVFHVEKVITPVRNARGEITHFISNDRDITDQRQLEAQLRQAQKMDAIGRLAGGVAHDFNNLLMVISAYAELTLDGLPAENELRDKAQEILTASRKAADLTRQLLAFGRKQLQVLQVLDLNRIVADVSKMLPRFIGEDIQVNVSAGKDLARITADPGQIEQILMNLAANARDAMPRGGNLTIETSNVQLDQAYLQRHAMVPPGEYVLLVVTDTGQGIAPEHLPHIFEPFYTTKEEGKGTGLGLATVYGIVKQSRGFIWVYSEPGWGTTFKIYLPSLRTAKGVDPVTGDVAEPYGRGTETVLFVEDETAVRESATEFLISVGYNVLEARDGKEALEVARQYLGPIDLIITDVVMPHMGGAQLAEQLQAERPQAKVLFVSGYAESTVLRHGAIDLRHCFLPKPFTLKTLARKIRQVVENQAASARTGA